MKKQKHIGTRISVGAELVVNMNRGRTFVDKKKKQDKHACRGKVRFHV